MVFQLAIFALEEEIAWRAFFQKQLNRVLPIRHTLLISSDSLLRRTGKMFKSLHVGPIYIDVDSYSVFENRKKITLTLKEFELLKVLMKNKGKVLSRQQLLNNVWGYDYFGDERVVDVHIKNIRKKFKANVIQTVKGVGYKVEDERGDAKDV